MKIVPIFFPNAGCKQRCIFCNEWMATMQALPRSVCDEIEKAYLFYHGNEDSELALYGGTFTAIPNWKDILLEAEKCMKKLGMRGIKISTRPDEIKDVTFLAKHGVTSIEVGVQSMCQDVLDAAKRGHTTEDVMEAVKKIKNAGMEVSVHLMTGLPKDTKSKSLFSAFTVADMKVNGVRIHPTLVLKKTELANLYLQRSYQPQTLKEAVDWVSDMLAVFLNADIVVERLGMYQDHQTLPNVVAGPYHPAFGELSKAALYRKFLISTGAKKVHAPKRLRSQIVGRNKDLDVEFFQTTDEEDVFSESEGGVTTFREWLEKYVSYIKEMAKCDS